MADTHDKKEASLTQVPSVVEERGTPKIKKRFNFWTAFGIAVCTSGSWEGWIASLAQGISGGGAVGLVWGWVLVSVGIVCMSCSLSEFVSMWPSAGGQYVWAANLSSPRYTRMLSWYTAWFGLAGMWLGAVSCGMGVAVQVQSYVATARDYDPKTWHAFLICIVAMICWILVNIFSVRSLHWLNQAVLIVHVAGYFIVIGVMLKYTENKHDAKYVFTHFEKQTGWDSDFVSWSVSLLSALYAFFSLDSASHFSEEIENANRLVPRAMVLQAVSSALMTFPFIIVILFCIGDTSAVLTSRIGLMSPFTQIAVNSTGSPGLSIFMAGLSTFVAMSAGFDLWGAAARSIWSMARDNALPPIFAQIHPKFGVPVLANLVMVPPSIGIYLIYIWNTTAFYGIMAGVLVAFQLSYVLPIGINIFYTSWRKPLVKGPFNMGKFSWIVHLMAFIFGCYMILFMSFPVYYPVTAANMNYASPILGAVFIFASLMWFFYGSKHYEGPLELLTSDGVRPEVDLKD
ncbi:putative GABA permease [Whalleya microplaca]|nr:putative GABA permease [Whalleya microplaca]